MSLSIDVPETTSESAKIRIKKSRELPPEEATPEITKPGKSPRLTIAQPALNRRNSISSEDNSESDAPATFNSNISYVTSPAETGNDPKSTKQHCLICHTDFGPNNKQCMVNHELYADKDIYHKSKTDDPSCTECWMVFCSYCNYTNCSANCEEFKDKPKECYSGEHIASKEQAKEEHLMLNRECTLCYPEEIDMLDFIMNKVMFQEDIEDEPANKQAKAKGKAKGKITKAKK